MHLRLGAPDRRRVPRGTPEAPRREELVTRILGMYREMPGLTIELPEACRLLGLPPTACRVILSDLVRHGQLRRDDQDRYVSLSGSLRRG